VGRQGGKRDEEEEEEMEKVMVWGIKSGRAVLISVAGCAAPVVRE